MRFLLALIVSILTASCGGGSNGGPGPAQPPSAPAIAIEPSDQQVPAGQAATFTVSATGATPLTYQWQRNASPIAGATAQAYTTGVTTPGDTRSRFAVVVSNASGSTTSRSATLTVATAAAGTDVLTYKNDLSRSGQNLSGTAATPANVASPTFGLLRNLAVDGKVDAQPLYVSQLSVSEIGRAH